MTIPLSQSCRGNESDHVWRPPAQGLAQKRPSVKVRFLSTFNTCELASSTVGEPALDGRAYEQEIHELVVDARQMFEPLQYYS